MAVGESGNLECRIFDFILLRKISGYLLPDQIRFGILPQIMYQKIITLYNSRDTTDRNTLPKLRQDIEIQSSIK
jgi:hypothetical protein